MMIVPNIFTIVFISPCASSILADYSYQNADDWANENPQCGGSRQSPIDLNWGMAENYNGDEFGEIKFEHILDTVAEKMILKNDGHTVKLLFEWPEDEESIPYVHDGPIDGEYIVHSFQFRWGSDINDGSEHRFQGNSKSMELQVVYYNKEYKSYEEAENSPNGLLIHSLFYRIESESDKFLKIIIEKFPEITEPGSATEIEPFPLGDVFDSGAPTIYMVYPGSLTHPPCYETVTWVISSRYINFSEKQVQAFKTLNLLNGDDHNNRPTQSVNNRKSTLSE